MANNLVYTRCGINALYVLAQFVFIPLSIFRTLRHNPSDVIAFVFVLMLTAAIVEVKIIFLISIFNLLFKVSLYQNAKVCNKFV